MKKNGFISTTLIYTFFILFLMLMLFLLNSYSRVRYLLDQVKYDIKNELREMNMADINVVLYRWNSSTKGYDTVKDVPTIGYLFEEKYSYCKNGSEISYNDGEIVVKAKEKDFCYAYFTESSRDINLSLYTKDSESSTKVYVNKVPAVNYEFTSASCDNGATINFDNVQRKFKISASKPANCEAIFTKKKTDITLKLYSQSIKGTHEYEGKKYIETKKVPLENYTLSTYACDNGANVDITLENNKLKVSTNKPTECNVYFDGGVDNVNLIIMQESTTGEDGYTAGKKYVETSVIPQNHRYVGYKCTDSNAKVKYRNNVLSAENNVETTCKAYFDRMNVTIKYYLQKENGGYEIANGVPRLGYVLNKSRSSCNITKTDVNNIPIIDSSVSQSTCNAYYDVIKPELDVQIYVMNRSTQKWELGLVPSVGYEMTMAECTNGANAQYVNGKLNIYSTKPTQCKIYFN